MDVNFRQRASKSLGLVVQMDFVTEFGFVAALLS
jgi:hypothetical protein